MHNQILILSAIAIIVAVTLFIVFRKKDDSKSKEKYYIEKYRGSPCCPTCPCGTKIEEPRSCEIKYPKYPEILYAVSPTALSDTIFNPLQKPQYTPLIQGMITLPVQKLYTY